MKIKKLLPMFILALCSSCSSDDNITSSGQVQENLQEKLDAAVSQFPGLSLSVKSANDNYTLVSGSAVLDEVPMSSGSLHYMQSISKTFTAVAILKLKEEGKISLDAKINTYLSSGICNSLANGNTITVRQLLNMTSGLPDYLDDEQFINDVLSGQLPMTSEHILSYVYGKPANFTPGSSFGYCNVNYHLLALIIDAVTDNGHRDYTTTKVINPAGLANTHYIAGSDMGSAPAGTTASYLAQEGSFIDISDLQLGTVLSFIGDDGIVATTQDIATFYYKLLHTKNVLSQNSLEEMKTAVNLNGQPIYGLGLHFYKTVSGLTAIGHEGSGAGAGAYAFYFPQKKISVTLSTNTGTLTNPDKESQFMDLWLEISQIILE